MVMTMKNIIFFGCSTVWLWFEPTFMLFTCPEDGGDTFLQNIGSNQSHTALHPRRWYSAY
jgi:hypothetical protein